LETGPVFDITICICTYDRYELVGKSIESAVGQRLDLRRHEILVVDNSPDRARAKAFQNKYNKTSNLTYLIEETPGLSNARNVGAQASRAPIIAFLDDDAVASPDWVSELLKAFETFGPQASIVGGRVDPIWSAPRPPWLHDALLSNLSLVDWGGQTRVAGELEWAAGTNIAFRVDAILAHGGFSPKLGRVGSGASLLSNEEIEVIARIRAAGGELIYAPNARVSHHIDAGRLTPAWFRKRAAWQAMSDFLMSPDRAIAEARTDWPEILKYFNALPPLERTVRGLIYETDDPDLFNWQVGAIYTMTKLLLAGFEGTELG
jgi:glycosyltransferase involved in cell wall biosynthesis